MLWYFIGSLVLFCAVIVFWFIFVFDFLEYYKCAIIAYLTGVLFLGQMYYFVRCFVSDPGIIPRNHPNFQMPAKELKQQEEEDTISNRRGSDTNFDKLESLTQKIAPPITTSVGHNQSNTAAKSEVDLNNSLIFHHSIKKGSISSAKSDDLEFYDIQESAASIFTSRRCNTCNIIRPPKASHCSICNNCVLNFDQ